MGILKYKNEDGAWESVESPGAVKYTEQSLTDEQKAQVRANIGIEDNGGGGALVVTGTLPTAGEGTDHVYANISELSLTHTIEEMIEAFQGGQEVVIRLKEPTNVSNYKFGGWEIFCAELQLESAEVLMAGSPSFYDFNAYGFGYITGGITSTNIDAVPIKIQCGLHTMPRLCIPSKDFYTRERVETYENVNWGVEARSKLLDKNRFVKMTFVQGQEPYCCLDGELGNLIRPSTLFINASTQVTSSGSKNLWLETVINGRTFRLQEYYNADNSILMSNNYFNSIDEYNKNNMSMTLNSYAKKTDLDSITPLIVTGNFPTGGINTSDGEITNSLTLSHTLAEICAAYEAGREVRVRLTSSDSYTAFGPWNLKFAELSVFYVQSNSPAAGYYTMNAAGMGFGQYTTTSTPLRLAANMSASTIQLFAPAQTALEVIENGTY